MRALLGIAVLLLASATGALAMPPKEARFVLDGVEYLYITGVNFTETAVLEPAADASAQLPIQSCAFVMLHPGTPNGRVVVLGLQSGGVPMEVYIDQFRLANGKRGYAYDTIVTEDAQTRLADVAVAGNATMRVSADRYFDPVSSSGNSTLDKADPDMLGTMSLLADGVRDDVTGAIQSGEAVEDAELHVHLRSNPDGSSESITRTFASPGVSPPTEAYGAIHKVPNLKLGGEATLQVTTTAYAPAGMNRLLVAVVSPEGDLIANVTLTPALLANDDATLTFPLTLLGDYTLLVTGEVALATYSMTLTMAPPPALDLHLWWEDVTYGHQAYQDYHACLDELGSPNAVIGTERVVGRPAPPRYNLAAVIVGVSGAVAAVTLGVKLASDQISLSAFRKGK